MLNSTETLESGTSPCAHTMAAIGAGLRVQAARISADAVAAAVALTNDCIKDGNAVEATSKAAASAWRSSQARTTHMHVLHAGKEPHEPCALLLPINNV